MLRPPVFAKSGREFQHTEILALLCDTSLCRSNLVWKPVILNLFQNLGAPRASAGRVFRGLLTRGATHWSLAHPPLHTLARVPRRNHRFRRESLKSRLRTFAPYGVAPYLARESKAGSRATAEKSQIFPRLAQNTFVFCPRKRGRSLPSA